MTGSRIAAVVLAAGVSRRMGGNKLLAIVNGRPLVRWAAEAAVGSQAWSVIVVTGHQSDRIEGALSGLPVEVVFNSDYETGLASSLAAGLARVPTDADGVVVLLGDMPQISSVTVDQLIGAFKPGSIVVPTFNGERGNPVLWSRSFIPSLRNLSGDVGGRSLIEASAASVILVPSDQAVRMDIDTPEALVRVGGTFVE